MPSAQRGARRPEQQLYIPGRGLLSKGSKCGVVPVAEKKSNLQNDSSKQVNSVCCEGFTGASNLKRHLKARRPDIQVYVPKAKLLASRVNELSHSSLNVLPQRKKESQEVKALSSCCNSENSPDVEILEQHLETEYNSTHNDKQCVDFPTQKLIWRADQVEEYLSNPIQLNEELVDDSFDAGRYRKSNLVIDVDHLESVYSSGYSSSSNEGSKSDVVAVAEKKSNLQSVSCKQVNSVCCEGFTGASNLKARRPDIQVYVPKAKLLASRVNVLSQSSLSVLPQREQGSQKVQALSSCCNSQDSPNVKILKIEDNSANNDKQCVDIPTQKSILWADQVEYLSNSIQLSEKLVEDSFDADRSKESNLVINVGHLEIAYSSGFSSTGNEDLKFIENKAIDFNEADSSHGILKQNQRNSEFNSLVQEKHDIEGIVKSEGGVSGERLAFLEKLLVGDKPIKKSLLAQILPCEAPLFPLRMEDEEKIRKREEILDRQMAFFDKLAAKAKSAKPKERVSVPVVPPEAPLFPGRENKDFLQMLEEREHIVERQIDTFDKMLVKPESGRSQKTNVFQWLEIPRSSANPKIGKVPDGELSLTVPYTKLDHIFYAPEDLNTHHSPAPLGTDLCAEVSLPINVQCTRLEHTFCALEDLHSYHSTSTLGTEVSQPFKAQCTKLEHTFCALESLNSYSPVTLNADLYTEGSLPFNVSSAELDHSFCTPECSYSQGSLVSLGADLYIPPPVPLNKPRSKLDHSLPAPEYLKSYTLSSDDFYIPAPQPLT